MTPRPLPSCDDKWRRGDLCLDESWRLPEVTEADVGEDARAPAGQDYQSSDVRIEEPTTIH
jgi:hypothetical protein